MMVKSSGPMYIVSAAGGIPNAESAPANPDGPPQVPPRMKKKGPALPEKPPHIKAKTGAALPTPSSQQLREPLKPRESNVERQLVPHQQREVLIAATRGATRERPVDKRQREPPKLLMPTSGLSRDPPRKELHIHPSARNALDDLIYGSKSCFFPEKLKQQQPPKQPVLLIPRGMLPAVSCALWIPQRDGGPRASRRETGGQIVLMPRSGSVTRSGSLTSQGSSGSDSETFPKSVLKKQKRKQVPNHVGGSCRKLEQKKNVTFNAFATVQLMEE